MKINLLLLLCIVHLFVSCEPAPQFTLQEDQRSFKVTTLNYHFIIHKQDSRYHFTRPDGTLIADAHSEGGLLIGTAEKNPVPVKALHLVQKEPQRIFLSGVIKNDENVSIELEPSAHYLKMKIAPEADGRYIIMARTAGIEPAFGMGDHAAFGIGSQNLQLEEFEHDPRKPDAYRPAGSGDHRMVSNFVIFPRQGFACINMDPAEKILKFTSGEQLQGVLGVREMPALYYFIGNPKQIYREFLMARKREGYPVYLPKHQWFGVGWEAFGALAWNTNQKTVKENVDRYLQEGYPLEWMVVGSGFWPSGAGEFDAHGSPFTSDEKIEEAKKLQATTSFGMWDQQKYPAPQALIDHFHQQGLIFTVGLRIAFIPGGPYTREGIDQGYFLKEGKGEPALFQVGFPRVPVYLLDTKKKDAVEWYVNLCQKWLDYGIDGFKEDLFGWPDSLPDDLIDPVNRKLMDQGVFVMGRNNYLGSACDIHRYNDFNYDQVQDRGPINGLAYAYSGFPYVYPDIIGGTGLATGRWGAEPPEKMRIYMMRYAQYAALNPSMSFGYGPWNFDEETNRVCLQAARLHHRLKPYIYSNAVKAFESGFPYPITPLPLVYPEDKQVYSLADTLRRSYQWLIGESLMATPVYGNDYATANSRNVYLPAGKWIDYSTGKSYQGPVTLNDFTFTVDNPCLFVGGEGIVVEAETDGSLLARIYPVKNQALLEFIDLDGKTRSQISTDITDWNKLQVTDISNGEEIKVSKNRHAWEFELVAGHNYQIK